MNNDCIFCKIAEGEIPSYTLYEDDRLKAFLEIRPTHEGHALIILKKHIPTIYDVEKDDYAYLMEKAQALGKLLKDVYGVERVALVAYGLDVAHAHIHLIPLGSGDEINFNHKDTPPQEELERIAEKIKKAL